MLRGSLIRRKLDFNEGFEDEESSEWDDSDQDPDFIPGTPEKQRKLRFTVDAGELGGDLQGCVPQPLQDTEDEYNRVLEEPAMAEETSEEEEADTQVSPRLPFTSPAKSPNKRKRKSHTTKIQRNKKRRNEGREYTTKSKNIAEARKIGEMCKCPLKCSEKINEIEKRQVFSAFWDMGDFNIQNAYLFGCVEKIAIKRRYCKNPEGSYKQNTFLFRVKIHGESIRVCKKSFMSVHGLQNSRGRINNILMNIKSNASTPPIDKRGKHSNRPRKIPDDVIKTVHDHINALPKYQSHYSRLQNPNKTYLGCDLNVSSLYNLYYLDYCKEKTVLPVTMDKYRRIFCEEYNIGFKFPKSDTCAVCDSLQIVIDNPEASAEEKRNAETQKELHLRMAEGIRKVMTDYTVKSKSSADEVHVISVDLQQTLPTPKLSCGPAFYSRKLWTYNVGIHNCSQGTGYMFMWDESVGKRGSDEIGSCILSYITLTNVKAKKLVVFSDNCGGQNKNWNIMSMWTYLVKQNRFEEIEHWFFVPGHTYLPSDRDFGRIEKYHTRHYQNVYSPDHWKEVIVKSGKFMVTAMDHSNILSLTKYAENINTKKEYCNDKKTKVLFSKLICFKFESKIPLEMKIKHRINAEFSTVSLKKKGREGNAIMHLKYNEQNKIDQKKLTDVKKLLKFIPPIYHDYYNKLIPQCTEVENNDVD